MTACSCMDYTCDYVYEENTFGTSVRVILLQI
jgi:hypothetical protein